MERAARRAGLSRDPSRRTRRAGGLRRAVQLGPARRRPAPPSAPALRLGRGGAEGDVGSGPDRRGARGNRLPPARSEPGLHRGGAGTPPGAPGGSPVGRRHEFHARADRHDAAARGARADAPQAAADPGGEGETRMTRKRSKRSRKKRNRGRRWVTVLLFLLVGFFCVSLYLGLRDRESDGPEAVPAAMDLPEPIVPTPGSPSLVVLNGCGRPGLGREVSRWFRRRGVDVFETGNADRMDHARTLVVQRSDRRAAVDRIAAALREQFGVGLRMTQRAEIPEADALLILGGDFPDSLPIR
ncbi:MAG: hypothetical protein GF346_05785 [Candidatus Eisenbacteria bacterium]|nr:hypothetical protein [Candidatus Latescibacterota bacterium]MBD3301939.1 hypothetical protein [Candidatus Eisenbacteria bacterium]